MENPSQASPAATGEAVDRSMLSRAQAGVVCVKCSYDIQGIPLDGVCPECGSGVRESILLGCSGCGYDLRGLRSEGACPECGVPVQRTIDQNLRLSAEIGYVRRLRSGLSWVLNGILLWLVVAIVAAVASGVTQAGLMPTGPNPAVAFPPSYIWVQAGGTVASLLATFVILWGFWLFTTPDPRNAAGRLDPASRKVLRVATVVHAVVAVINSIAGVVAVVGMVQMLNQMSQQGGSGTAPHPSTTVFGGAFFVASIVGGLAGVGIYAAIGTAFFSSMLYVRRLAVRIPDMKIHRLAKSRMIACPIWGTVGILILVGPLIALVLYWNLLNMLSKQLKAIVRDREHAGTG